jgi:riboflavin kinase/FMN adenylyltransferase
LPRNRAGPSGLRDKLQLLAAEGVDRVLCLAFNQRLSKLSAASSSTPSWSMAWACSIWKSATTSAFGCDRVGDFDFLQQAGVMHGFTVEAAQTVELDGLRSAAPRCAMPWPLPTSPWPSACSAARTGLPGVLHGQKLARQLGTPTANIQLKRRRVPLTGVTW